MPAPTPITWDGREFPSLGAACAAAGVPESTVRSRVAAGHSIEVAIGLLRTPPPREPFAAVGCKCGARAVRSACWTRRGYVRGKCASCGRERHLRPPQEMARPAPIPLDVAAFATARPNDASRPAKRTATENTGGRRAPAQPYKNDWSAR